MFHRILKYRQHVPRPLPDIDYSILGVASVITLYNYIKSFFRNRVQSILVPLYNMLCIRNSGNNELAVC